MSQFVENKTKHRTNALARCSEHCLEPQYSQKIAFGNLEIDLLTVKALLAMMILFFIVIISTLLYLGNHPGFPEDIYAENVRLHTVDTSEEMISLLKEHGIWKIASDGAVSSLLFASYPDNINEMPTKVRKRVFFHGLLPVALTALAEIKNEKKILHDILKKFPGGYKGLVFSDDYGSWGRYLTVDEIEFITMLTVKYRTNLAIELVKRIDLIPISMILAQGAIESSWATSRFAQEGNNLFGVWTWKDKGLIPEDRDDDMNHKVAMYDSILDSIRAYLLTLNRLPAYRQFREIRKNTMNPLKLAEGLLFYSQRRHVYVGEIQNFITYNELRQYDKCFLTHKPPQNIDNPTLKLTSLLAKNHVS